VTFNELAGTLILYDFRGIHRAQPFARGLPRTAMFAQYGWIGPRESRSFWIRACCATSRPRTGACCALVAKHRARLGPFLWTRISGRRPCPHRFPGWRAR
jgi:hypothetical protein